MVPARPGFDVAGAGKCPVARPGRRLRAHVAGDRRDVPVQHLRNVDSGVHQLQATLQAG